MKTALLALPLLLAAAPAMTLAADDTEAAAALTIDSPIEALMANDEAKAVVMENMGGDDLTQHPMYGSFKSMSLKAVQPYSEGAITDEMLANIAAGLAEID